MVRRSDYYIWLRELTGNHTEYDKLIKQLDMTPFEWIFALDENRAAGGLGLREAYADENSLYVDDVRTGPCTVLEMLIGVANHMVDQLSDSIETWFWVLITNLNLDKFDDDDYDPRGVEYLLNCWLKRNYDEHGNGSLFPLKHYTGDCRFLDIWSQMNAWINENYPTDDSWLN